MRDPLVIRLQSPTQEQRSSRWMRLFWVVPALLLVILIAGVLGYIWYVHISGLPETEEIADLVDDVGLLMLLPVDEQPTVATVTNLDALRDQPFFEHAQIGDRVLMYPKAGRAILYSPSRNMIIEVAPIVLDTQ